MWPIDIAEEEGMGNFIEASVGFQSGTIWSFYLWIIVFFSAWALIMLRAGMNKGKKRD